MPTLLIALGAGLAFIVAYHTYGRWLGSKIFELSASAVCPSHRLRDDSDYVPTHRSIVFGHHFTSIAGTGPIVGPAIAVMWGWLPALLWVVFGSILIGAVHDLGSLVVSLRNNGQTVGDIAGRVINRRVRLLFLLVLFLALTIVLAIFGLVIAAVFKQYPAAIFPCMVQVPLAVGIGLWLHRRGVGLLIPSILALSLMYATVMLGDTNFETALMPLAWVMAHLHSFNEWFASLSMMTWVAILLCYSYVASVLPVWTLLQPRDYINALQLLSAMALLVLGLIVAAMLGGSTATAGGESMPLELVAPVARWSVEGAPLIFPFLFITIACGAISGFHCLVSSGTSSKQLEKETDARMVGYGSMLTEGFLAVLVILACVAGLGLGVTLADGSVVTGQAAFDSRYASWAAMDAGLAPKVAAFVDGAANFLATLALPVGVATALMGVLVASFAATTLDTATRLQRYVVQELAATLTQRRSEARAQVVGAVGASDAQPGGGVGLNPVGWLTNKHAATIFAVTIAAAMAAMPAASPPVSFTQALRGDVDATLAAVLAEARVAPPVIAAMSAGGVEGAQAWSAQYAGRGGLILWPMFGATNQLLGGLAFMVIAFWLWRRQKPVWFLILPMIFMLIMPAWAMIWQVFVSDGGKPGWWFQPNPNRTLIFIALATLALEAWMIVEAWLLWPKVKGLLEPTHPPPAALALASSASTSAD